MATLSGFITEAVTDIDAIAGGTRDRMSQDYADNTSEFTASGQTKYQLRASHLSIINDDSQAPRTIINVDIEVHHLLATFGAEQAYRDGQMSTDQLALITDAFWSTMVAVYSVAEDFPVVSEPPVRAGKIISYTVSVQLALA